LKVEADTTYYFPRGRALAADLHVDTTTVTNGALHQAAEDRAFADGARPVVDTALGVEYFVLSSLSVLGGVSTDISRVRSITLAPSVGTFQEARISRLAVSFGLGSYGDAGTVLFGTQLSMGWGQALAVNPYTLPNGYAAVDAQTFGAMLVVAGSTNLRALRGAVESVEELVRPKTEAPR
jgi:hypothetical protein